MARSEGALPRLLEAIAAWRDARDRRASGALEIEQAHRSAVATQRADVARYTLRRRSLQAQFTGGVAVAGATGTVGVLDVVGEVVTGGAGVYGPAWLWLGATVVSAGVALRARRRRRRLQPPAPPTIPPPPAQQLPRDAVGAAEAARYTALRVQLLQVAPAIDSLHPSAGAELRVADAEAAPALNTLVHRLAVLDHLMRSRSGVPGQDVTAEAAYDSALELSRRLDAGCAAYDALLAACARLMAAPDLGRGTDAVLGPALDAMVAYAHGLRQAEASFDDPRG